MLPLICPPYSSGARATCPWTPSHPCRRVQKATQGPFSAPSAADVSLVHSQRRLALVSLTEGGCHEQHDTAAAASSRPADIGPLSEWLSEKCHSFYGTPAEIEARQQSATAQLARKTIATSTICLGDERDSVMHEPDINEPFDGLDVSDVCGRLPRETHADRRTSTT
jgi:hypothetical protein